MKTYHLYFTNGDETVGLLPAKEARALITYLATRGDLKYVEVGGKALTE